MSVSGMGYPRDSSLGALEVRGSDLLFLGRHLPRDEVGNPVRGNFEAQLRAAYLAMKRTLAAAQLGFDSIICLTVYTEDVSTEDIAQMTTVHMEFAAVDSPVLCRIVPVAPICCDGSETVRVAIDGLAFVKSDTHF